MKRIHGRRSAPRALTLRREVVRLLATDLSRALGGQHLAYADGDDPASPPTTELGGATNNTGVSLWAGPENRLAGCGIWR